MLERLKNKLVSENLETDSKPFLIAVSGGLDSMVLLDLLRRAGLKLIVAHVNYQLRKEESNAEQALIQKYCNEHHITCEVFKIKKPSELEEGNLQQNARNIRYQFFNDLVDKHDLEGIMIAHHSDDQFEGALIGTFRGEGIQILKFKDGIRIRPLLEFAKSELESYAIEFSVPYLTDSSNQKNIYLRNVIRNRIVPEILKLDPYAKNKVLSLAQRTQLDQELIKELLQPLKDQITLSGKIRKSEINGQRHLYHLIKEYGFSHEQCKQIYKNIENVSSQFESGQFRILVDREFIYIKPIDMENKTKSEATIEKTKDNKVNFWEGRSISITRHKDKTFSDVNNISVDANQLIWPLTIRSWQNGDAFQPIGMKGKTKKLKKFFVDEKVPLTEKENIPLLIDAEGKIIWVMGYRMDHRVRITDKTKRILNLSFS